MELPSTSVRSCAAVPSLPSLLERRQRTNQGLFGVVIEAYLHEASTRKVDDLVKALGSKPASPGPTAPELHCCSASAAGKTPATTCLAACADPE